MRLTALALVCALSACAVTYVANPNDPVDMTAELGNRAREYVGMGEVCDSVVGAGHRAAIVQAVQVEQRRLGVLADLVNRAYRGRATSEIAARLQAETSSRNTTAQQFCAGLVSDARADLDQRATSILSLHTQPDLDDYVRRIQEPNS